MSIHFLPFSHTNMPLSLPLFFLIPLALTISSPTTASAANDPPAGANAGNAANLIAETCKKTVDAELCIKTLNADPNSQRTNVKGLSTIALKAAHTLATETAEHITELQGKAKDAFTEQCLNDCSEHYLDAVDQLEDSLSTLDSNGFGEVNTWVTAAIADAEACEEAFKNQPGYKSPLSNQNGDLSKLCRNALAIVKLVTG